MTASRARLSRRGEANGTVSGPLSGRFVSPPGCGAVPHRTTRESRPRRLLQRRRPPATPGRVIDCDLNGGCATKIVDTLTGCGTARAVGALACGFHKPPATVAAHDAVRDMARILSAVIEDGKRVPQLGDHQRSRERGGADHHRDIIAEPLHTRALTGQKRTEEGRRGQKRALPRMGGHRLCSLFVSEEHRRPSGSPPYWQA